MAMSQASAEALERYRTQLRAAERDPVDRITRARTAAMKQIRDEVNAVLAAAAAQGITSSAVAGLPQHRRLLQLIDDHLIGLGRVAAGPIERAQRAAIAAAEAEARAFAAGQTRSQARAEQLNRAWRAVPEPEIDDYAGKVPDGTAFAEVIAKIGPDVGRLIGDDLAKGLHGGVAVAAMLDKAETRVESGYRRALSLAQDAIYDSSRWATDRLLAANAGELTGGQRLESVDEMTCVVCMALHGKKYSPGTPFERHPNCRGVLVPLLADGDDLGIESGEVILRRLPESEQLKVFNGDKTAHTAWASGELALSDFVEVHETPNGPQTSKLGLKDARRNRGLVTAAMGGSGAGGGGTGPKRTIREGGKTGLSAQTDATLPGYSTDADRELAQLDIPEQPGAWRQDNTPAMRLQVGGTHRARQVKQGQRKKGGRTPITIIEEWIQMDAEIEAINRGDGRKINELDFEINGRVYHRKGKDVSGSYPLSGPGVHLFNNAEVYVLGVYNSDLSPEMEERVLRPLLTQTPPPEIRFDLVRAISDQVVARRRTRGQDE